MIHHEDQAAVWKQHADRWSRVSAPPMKPSPEDGQSTLAGLGPALAHDPCRVAVLGVTPELIDLPWPRSVELVAYDHSAEMIASVWHPHPGIRSTALLADWRNLPAADATFHAAAGDGSLNALPHLDHWDSVLRELCRVLVPHAPVALRCYVRPDQAEPMADIVSAANAGLIGGFNALKWRIAMSIAGRQGASVAVSDIHAAFSASFPSREDLARAAGWPRAIIDTIDAYKGAKARYTFPAFDEIQAMCEPCFDIESTRHGTYELADRCPTLTMRRNPKGAR